MCAGPFYRCFDIRYMAEVHVTFVYHADPVRGAKCAEIFARKMSDMPFRPA